MSNVGYQANGRFRLRGPYEDGIYHYGPSDRYASIELSGGGRSWFATIRFMHQERDVFGYSSEEALERAMDWVDKAPELSGYHHNHAGRMKANTTLDHTPSAEEWFKRYPDLGREPLFTIRFKVGHPVQNVTIRAYEGPPQSNVGNYTTHTTLFCELRAPGVIFPRENFYVGLPSGTTIDGDDAKEAVMALFAMKPGDTDSEFFKDYTPAQLEFVESYGEDIYMIKLDRYGER